MEGQRKATEHQLYVLGSLKNRLQPKMRFRLLPKLSNFTCAVNGYESKKMLNL